MSQQATCGWSVPHDWQHLPAHPWAPTGEPSLGIVNRTMQEDLATYFSYFSRNTAGTLSNSVPCQAILQSKKELSEARKSIPVQRLTRLPNMIFLALQH